MHRIAIAALALAAGTARAQLGQINPPLGPVADTGPDLFQIEPRTPLSLETTPGDSDSIFKITSPGSYYLTGNIRFGGAAVDFNAIEIVATDVIIDLNGFTIDGIEAGGYGVRVIAQGARVTVKNGNITSFRFGGVYATGRMSVVRDVNVNNIVDNQSAGIRVGRGGLVENCTVENVQNSGIRTSFDGLVRNCRVFSVSQNGYYLGGFSRVENSVSAGAGLAGFRLEEGAQAVDCLARSSDRSGFYGLNSAMVTRGVSINNDLAGYEMLNNGTVRDSVARGNTDGFVVGDGSILVGNAARDNASIGLLIQGSGGNIDRNTASGSQYGFYCFGQGNADNAFTRNVADSNSLGNYFIISNDNYHRISTDPATAGPMDNISQ
ncbi:MAG: right-handed parallel beta-helix repeat-containing protein [Planctomycetota bacterium]